MKAAIYLRCSTNEKKQDTENQRREIIDWLKSNGHELAKEYEDYSSGKNDHNERKALYELLNDAKKPRRGFDLLVFYDLSRLTREGVFKTLTYLEIFKAHNLQFHSVSEPYISTIGPFSDVVISLMSTLNKLERERTVEKIKIGLETAKKKGKKLGRPQKAKFRETEIRSLRNSGMSVIEISRKIKLSESSVRRVLAA